MNAKAIFDDPKVAATYAHYMAREAHDRAKMSDPELLPTLSRDDLLLSVGEDVAVFLHSLILARKPKRILELGTSYGYSTLFLADAARKVGARLTSMEIAQYKQDFARTMLTDAGLIDHVDLRCGDAVEMLAADGGRFDFVLLDVWKELYLPCFNLVYPMIEEEGILCADNMIDPESARPEIRKYRAAVLACADLRTTLLPIGQGIELSVRWSSSNSKL